MCMCWCMCCMRATCEVSCVQGAVMGARFNVRGLKVSLEAGVLCSAVTCGAWGAFVRREPGQGDVAWGGALCSWCMRGCAKQALSQGKSSRTQAATTLQPAISQEVCPSLLFYYPVLVP